MLEQVHCDKLPIFMSTVQITLPNRKTYIHHIPSWGQLHRKWGALGTTLEFFLPECWATMMTFVYLCFHPCAWLFQVDSFSLEIGDFSSKKSSWLSSVHSLSHVWLFVTPQTAARQASLSFTNSQSLLKLMSIESTTPSNHLILYLPLLLLPSVFPGVRVFSNELTLRIR